MGKQHHEFNRQEGEKKPAKCLGLIADLQKVADARQEDLITSQLNRAQCGLILRCARRDGYNKADTLLKTVLHRLTQQNTLEEAYAWLIANIVVIGLADSKGLPRPEYAEPSIALVLQQPSPRLNAPALEVRSVRQTGRGQSLPCRCALT